MLNHVIDILSRLCVKVCSCRYENLAIHSSSNKIQYHTDCALLHRSLFEISALQICEMFVHKHTETTEYVKKYNFVKKIQTLRINNSRILRIQKAKFLGYNFYMYTNIWRDFQICVSLPLNNQFLKRIGTMQLWKMQQITKN